MPLRGDYLEEDYAFEVDGARLQSSPIEDDGLKCNEDERQDLYVAASIAHLSFLKSIKRDVDDEEFSAAALGAFDGTVQALERKLSHLDMFSMGAAFIFKQLKDLRGLDEVDAERIADLTTEAMTSNALKEIREQAGQVAYSVTITMRPSRPLG